jgi:hypothetical protein
MRCPNCGSEISDLSYFEVLKPFHVLFDKNRKPKSARIIQQEVSDFSEVYDTVVKKIIYGSSHLDERSFKLNVATLLPSFGMTRNSLFHGLKIRKNTIMDPGHVLEICWTQSRNELKAIKQEICNQTSDRSRAILELQEESKNYVIASMSELFDKLEWTRINGRRIGRVGASKILFSVLPEAALPVDNAEWDDVFGTHCYGKVLSTMIEEINEWEKNSKAHLETLDPKSRTTVTSIYNVMAMAAR